MEQKKLRLGLIGPEKQAVLTVPPPNNYEQLRDAIIEKLGLPGEDFVFQLSTITSSGTKLQVDLQDAYLDLRDNDEIIVSKKRRAEDVGNNTTPAKKPVKSPVFRLFVCLLFYY